MPERNNKRENQTTAEQEINKENTSRTDSKAKEVIEGFQQIKERLEAIKRQTVQISEEQSEMIKAAANKKDAASLDTSKTGYATTLSTEQIADAENAVRRQVEKDDKERMAQEVRLQNKSLRNEISKVQEKEARARAEKKIREAEEKKRKAAEVKAAAEEMARIKRESEELFEEKERQRQAEREENERKKKLLGSQSKQMSHSQQFVKKLLEKQEENLKREQETREREELDRRQREKRRQREEERRAAEERRRALEIQAEYERKRAEEEKQKALKIKWQEERQLELARQAEEIERQLAEENRAAEEERSRAAEAEKRQLELEAKLTAQLAAQQAEIDRRAAKKAQYNKPINEIRKAEEKRKKLEYKKKEIEDRERQKLESIRLKNEQKETRKREKEARDLLIAQQREAQKRRRAEEKLRIIAERKAQRAKLKEERTEKNELRRKKKLASEAAAKGGGIVQVHETTIATEILPVPAFSWKTLLGLEKRQAKKLNSEKKKQELLEQKEKETAEARAVARGLAAARRTRIKNSRYYKKYMEFLSYCDENKKKLFIALGILLMAGMMGAGVMNLCTAYEYSYNGVTLGYVKEKDTVLQITKMVQDALTEDKNVDVVIDAGNDVGFKKKLTINKDIAIDSSDQVLKRLTYMGDLNVKSYGIYLDGQKVGAVYNKETAANVLMDIKDKYQNHAEGSKVDKAEIIEEVVVKDSNTPLRDVLSEGEMVDKLCASGERDVVYTIQKGDTFESVAKSRGISEEELIKQNDGVDPNNPKEGETITFWTTAPLLTVKITETREYEKKLEYNTIKKKDKDLYEGFTEVDQEGQKGISDVKETTVSYNGVVNEEETEYDRNDVQKEPVDKIVRIGTKERPPTVGSGTYIWPANKGTYVVTSEFKWRWGRQHQGIDMGCSTGTDVLAADGGTVTIARYYGGYGNLVVIDHQNGIETYYGHNSALLVSEGDKVFQGQHIAEAGNTGNSFGSHIHFGVKDHGTFKNPRNYLPKQ